MKNSKEKMGKTLQTILKKMCKIVNADFEKMDFQKQNWFWDYEWTQKQEDKFRVWMNEYLSKNKEARESFMEYPRKDKKSIVAVVNAFCWNYGWKVKK